MSSRQIIRLVTADPRCIGENGACNVDKRGPALVFFYMDGVLAADSTCRPAEHGLWDEWAGCGAALKICRSAWERRRSGSPSPPFALASLTDLALAVEQAEMIECLNGGRQTNLAGLPRSGSQEGPFGLLVSADPVYDPNREIVDLALAFALLDLPLAVIFVGRGLFHLAELNAETIGRWRTLVDLTAARLHGAAADAERFSFTSKWAAVEWRDSAGISEAIAGCRFVFEPQSPVSVASTNRSR